MSTAIHFAAGSSTDFSRPVQPHVSTQAAAAVPQTSAKPRLRITARGRAVVMVLVALPVVGAAVAMGINGGGAIATGSSSSVPLESVTVMAGQSLWDLAERVAPQVDPREFISDVISTNTLVSAEVHPGQQLDIPSEYAH